MPQSAMSSNIQTVVMLMLENRSLDNLFGYLYTDQPPHHFYPDDPLQQFNGIPFGAALPAYDWWGNLKQYWVRPIPAVQLVAKGDDPAIIPWWDPTEEYISDISGRGVVNQMFGNQNMVSALPPNNPTPGMLGFLQDYWTWMDDSAYDGMDITWMFTKDLLPNLYFAAKAGAISDAWFSSVPTQTNPNRAFSLVGTSLGREANLHYNAVEQFDSYTLFEGLASCRKTCGLYYSDIWVDNQCFTQYTFPSSTNGLTRIGTHDDFYADAAAGSLPNFCYVEPKWGYGLDGNEYFLKQGTDLHPPSSVTPGDQFVGEFLNKLSQSPQWRNMLIIITFDEHGGTYDHVAPAWGAKPPDRHVGETGFKFDLFGVRVPTLLVSPWVRPFTVFRAPAGSDYPFDHTSVIQTLMAWAGGDASKFLARAQAAPAFDGVLITSGKEATDNGAALQRQFQRLPLPPSYPMPEPVGNPLFEGVPFASVRAILATSTSVAEIVRKIANYRRDPAAFEARLIAGDDKL